MVAIGPLRQARWTILRVLRGRVLELRGRLHRVHALLLHHCILRRRAYGTVSPLSRCSFISQTWLRWHLLIEQLRWLTLLETRRLPRPGLG